ncbi:MAG TPA: metalloregulator ArsR/SmtB family transcription factor [Protaetiibacter sp.]|jgi:DNA-binding transcriptional ArsR family regulator|nr:metalloregulator ArsR/SmtB family transcription factor [Protaetiibacter sp.]
MSAGASAETIDDELWSAVGDPTRRRMLSLLLGGEAATATALSARLPITRQAVSKHLGVLDRAGLLSATEVGREKRYRLDDAQFARAVAQLNAVSDEWGGRLQRIKRLAETIQASGDDRDE